MDRDVVLPVSEIRSMGEFPHLKLRNPRDPADRKARQVWSREEAPNLGVFEEWRTKRPHLYYLFDGHWRFGEMQKAGSPDPTVHACVRRIGDARAWAVREGQAFKADKKNGWTADEVLVRAYRDYVVGVSHTVRVQTEPQTINSTLGPTVWPALWVANGLTLAVDGTRSSRLTQPAFYRGYIAFTDAIACHLAGGSVDECCDRIGAGVSLGRKYGDRARAADLASATTWSRYMARWVHNVCLNPDLDSQERRHYLSDLGLVGGALFYWHADNVPGWSAAAMSDPTRTLDAFLEERFVNKSKRFVFFAKVRDGARKAIGGLQAHLSHGLKPKRSIPLFGVGVWDRKWKRKR